MTDVRLALLEIALDEEVGGRAPPDLWPRIARRQPKQPKRSRGLVAALVLAAAAVVIAVLVLDAERRHDERAPAAPQWPDRLPENGPQTLDEAMSWLRNAGLRSVNVRADRVWSPALARFVLVDRHPFESFALFAKPDNRLDLRRDDGKVTVDALLRATPVAASSTPWEFTLKIQLRKRREVVVRVGGLGQRPRFAIAGRDRLWPIDPHPRLAQLLENELPDFVEQLLRERGTALSVTALRALPVGATRIRPVAIGAAAASEFARFTKLRSLDLSESPALGSAALLDALRQCADLRSLTLDGSSLTRDAIDAIGRLTQLEELFVMSGNIFAVYPQIDDLGGAESIDDDAVAALVGLRSVKELMLLGAPLTDAGLARLAELPRLSELALLNCPNIRGSGFSAFAGHPALRKLNLSDSMAFDSPGESALAALDSSGVRVSRLPSDDPR